MYGNKHVSGHILKKIRLDLDLHQKDLRCKGIQNVSRIENGDLELTCIVAHRLCDKINQIMVERNLTLDYDVTVDLLMGRTSILEDELLYKLKNDKEETELILKEINKVIDSLKTNEAINFIINVIEILDKNIYENSKYICTLSYKLLSYNIENSTRVDAFNYLIRGYFVQEQFQTVANIGKSFTNEVVKNATTEQKEKFFGNIANSYFRMGEYNECEEALKVFSIFKSKEKEIFCMCLKAICKSQTGECDEAVKIYENIILKSDKIKNIDYIANSYSNIGDIYLDDDIEKARLYINKSIELLNQCCNEKFILNCCYNKFLLSIKEQNLKEIDNYFRKSFDIALRTKDIVVCNKIVLQILRYCIKNSMEQSIPDFIQYLNYNYKYSINDSTLIDTLKHINDSNLIFNIIKIAQNYKDVV